MEKCQMRWSPRPQSNGGLIASPSFLGFAHHISSNNVLIKLTDEAEMKITDFAVWKPASETKSFSITGDGVKGTHFWLPSCSDKC